MDDADPEAHYRVFWELPMGAGGLTWAIGKLGLSTTRESITQNHDITNDEGFIASLEYRARWKHLAPPGETTKKTPLSETATETANRCAAIAEDQDERGLYFSVENPEGSPLWELKAYQRLAKRPGVKRIRLDHCAYGGPHLVTTAVMHNAPWLTEGRRCHEVPAHRHTRVSKEERSSGRGMIDTPTGLYEEWASGWQTWLNNSELATTNTASKETYVRLGKYQNKLVRAELVQDRPH